MPDFFLREPVILAVPPITQHTKKDRLQIISSNPTLIKLAKTKNLLMLQGPVGSLFNRISAWKLQSGSVVHRIVFNGGDESCCNQSHPIRFVDDPEKWPEFLKQNLSVLKIDGVLLFGQTRIYHLDAIHICNLMGIPVFVMEEGYIRPGFLTLEIGGVNAWSTTLSCFKWSEESGRVISQPVIQRNHRLKMGFHTLHYYLALKLRSREFPNYRHHRHGSLLRYAFYWIKSALSLAITKPRDKIRLRRLKSENPNFYFVPLQLDTDSQIIFHSTFRDTWDFLTLVMRSFAQFAPDSDWLIIKQHPLARGKWGIGSCVMKLAFELGISERVLFIQDCRIHELVKASSGVVTVNSTVGLQAIYGACPLKVLGEAIYKVKGIADSQPLDDFWRNPHKPNPIEARSFYESLKELTQVPGMLYEFSKTPLDWSYCYPIEGLN